MKPVTSNRYQLVPATLLVVSAVTRAGLLFHVMFVSSQLVLVTE